MDNLLRVYFAIPEVRNVLAGEAQDPGLGVVVITELGHGSADPLVNSMKSASSSIPSDR